MAREDRDFDKTHLSIDQAEARGFIHRDYIAHCLRWSHVCKWLMQGHSYKSSVILDIGCGKELPLAKLLYSSRMTGGTYIGVDLNKLELPEALRKAVENDKLKVELYGKTDASSKKFPSLLSGAKVNVAVSFEAFEHMNPKAARQLLKNVYKVLEPGGTFFISTPCWNGQAAANHINETTYQALGWLLEEEGFFIQDHFGTFASIRDYEDQLSIEETAMFNRLRQYYDTNYLATVFAPLFPEHSRNCLWHCVKMDYLPSGRKFIKPKLKQELWSQHKDWRALAQQRRI